MGRPITTLTPSSPEGESVMYGVWNSILTWQFYLPASQPPIQLSWLFGFRSALIYFSGCAMQVGIR
ncbi:unnamed protein product [Penicillium roqueforti FM164]|uniref:Uncharacterized protein n=1 Tax=Penicillium roqueforti (strain FM164) TaxID=1365484 RepID=W6QRF9_PENRF|nr:unnamed protein product [Penicillium roqueforti FM164]